MAPKLEAVAARLDPAKDRTPEVREIRISAPGAEIIIVEAGVEAEVILPTD